jgi:diguanylate cyclase (GGDEF)-like protein
VRAEDCTHILVVESDRSMAHLAGELLYTGWEGALAVTQAERIEDANQLLLSGSVSAILLGDTAETVTLEHVRLVAPAVPIVILARSYVAAEAIAALQAGAQDVLARSELTAGSLRLAISHAIERKRSETQLAHRALQDPLTGLPNRTLFLDRLGLALDRARRTGLVTGVLFLDVDHFKQINDSLGHAAGDRVLSALAARLRGVLRPMDTVARFGGDEFTFLFEDLASPNEAAAIADRVRETATAPIPLEGIDHSLTVSIGVATASGPGVSPESLVREADAAMYRAKRRGGGEAAIAGEPSAPRWAGEPSAQSWAGEPSAQSWAGSETAIAGEPPAQRRRGSEAAIAGEPSAQRRGDSEAVIGEPPAPGLRDAIDRAELAAALRGAIGRDELRVVYQPRFGLTNGGAHKVAGFEALVRWQHPERGMIPPREFIPLAEELGIVDEIGAFVLAEVLPLLSHLREQHAGLTASVNLSADQLGDAALAGALAAVEAAGLQPGALCLEIPERTVSAELDTAIRASRVLRSAGIRVAIDDYGTGAVPLHSLRRLQADELKIHESFVGELDGIADGAIVGAVVELGHALGMTVVAEGVETDSQLGQLRLLGCDSAQGYHLCRPVGAQRLEELIMHAV